MTTKKKPRIGDGKQGHTPHDAPIAVRANHSAATETVTATRTLSVADAFRSLRSEAASVAEERAVDFRAELPLALHNARIGVDAVLPFAARIGMELPTVPFARVSELPNYVRGVMYADSLSTSPRAITGDDIAGKLAELQEIRIPALLQLQVFKAKKMASAAVVDAIVEGRGTLNFAQDGIDIEREFTAHHDAWRGKHPFSDEEIARAGTLGNWLLDHVQPDGATPRPEGANEYDLLRRQFWAIVTELHRHLRTIGVVLWGEEGVDEHIPKLQTRQVTRPVAEPVTPPAPAPV